MATYKAEQLELLKDVPIEELDLQARDLSCLKRKNVQTIGDLLKMNKSEMILLNAMRRLSIEHIEERLYSYVESISAEKTEIKEHDEPQSSPNWDPIREHNKEEKGHKERYAGSIPPGCRACGGPYPNCCDSCPMFDD